MLLEKVRETIQRYGMLRAGERVVVAVSGGPDSVALLRALHALRQEFSLQLIVAHFDHRMRPDSHEDARFVEQLVERLEMPFERGEAQELLRSEAEARRARYRFLQEAARKHNAQAVALGHTLNDRVETFFLNLLRGAGLEGLAGMPPTRVECGLQYVRPLIECTRAEVLAYLQELGQPYREDPTNRDRRYLRNRIRLDWMPLWEGLRPRALEAVARASNIAARAHAHFTRHVQELFPRIVKEERLGKEIVLCRAELLAQDEILREYLLREAVCRLFQGQDSQAELRAAHLERLMGEIERPRSGQQILLPKGVRVWVEPERVVFTRRPAHPLGPRDSSDEYELHLGENDVGIGWRFRLELREGSHPPPQDAGADPLEARMDWDTIAKPLRVRSRRPGDRLRPLGLGGTKKVQDLFVDAKVPQKMRDRIPLFCDENGVLWVLGLALDERGRVTPKTKQTLIVQALPTSAESGRAAEFLKGLAQRRRKARVP